MEGMASVEPIGTRIVARMGEYVLGAAPDVLATSGLGSCVGVAIYEARLQAGGLAHVSEPGAGVQSRNPKAHADIAIAAMVAELEAMGGLRTFMIAILAGGGEMFGFELAENLDIGRRNVQSALDALAQEMVRVTGQDVLGNQPRSMVFRLTDGSVTVESMGETHRMV